MDLNLDQTKATLRWKAVQTTSFEGGYNWVPFLVDRPDTAQASEVAYEACDRGYLVGIKPSAARQIAEELVKYIGQELLKGRAVQFGNYFRIAPFLTGCVTGPTAELDPIENAIRMKFTTLDGLKTSNSNFNFVNVRDGEAPRIDNVISDAAGVVRGQIKKGSPINVNGSGFGETAANIKVRVEWLPDGAEEKSHVDLTPSTINDNLCKCAWSSALNDIPVGAKVSITVLKTITVEETQQEVASNSYEVTVLAA